MKYILLTLFLATVSMSAQEPQKIVVGGNNTATLGQVVAGYNNGYHVGIRTPIFRTTSLQQEDSPLAPFPCKIGPNPCDRTARFYGEPIKTICVYDIAGNEVINAVNYGAKTIQFPSSGLYIVKITSAENSSRTFTIISK